MICVKQIVNEIFASNTYILSHDNSNDYWLVDVGDFKKVIDILPPNASIKGVFLTHSHFDHIYGLNEMYRLYPNSVVFTSDYGKDAVYSEKKNFSYYHDSPFSYIGDNVFVLKDKQKIYLWDNVFIEVLFTPGHCPSCLTYILKDYIFTGDSYIPNVPLVTKLPRGNRNLALESLTKIKKMAIGKYICAGHGIIVKDL